MRMLHVLFRVITSAPGLGLQMDWFSEYLQKLHLGRVLGYAQPKTIAAREQHMKKKPCQFLPCGAPRLHKYCQILSAIKFRDQIARAAMQTMQIDKSGRRTASCW